MVNAWRTTAAGYSDEELRFLLDFQRRLEEIVREQLARLRGEATDSRRGRRDTAGLREQEPQGDTPALRERKPQGDTAARSG